MDQTQATDKPIVCPTPEKNAEPLLVKAKECQTVLPEKYRTLADLFSHMSCSLRLLHLRKKTPTFQNVCSQVEVLSRREFSYSHLAQIKYILPEGVCIEKELVHDKKSLCMKPDMKITLIFDVVKEHTDESVTKDLALRRYFSSKLIDFFNMHPKATDIPEARLPEPFQRKICRSISENLQENSSEEPLSTSNQIEMFPEKCQLYPSFSRHFSRNIGDDQTEKVQCFSSTKISPSSNASDCLHDGESEKECPMDHMTNLNMERGQQKESSSMSFQPSITDTPVHMVQPLRSISCSSSESPLVKIVSSMADTPRTETPAQSAPKRLLPVSGEKLQNMPAPKSTSSCKPAKRVLDFTFTEGNGDLDSRIVELESNRVLHGFDTIPEFSSGYSQNSNPVGSVSVPQEMQAEESLGYSLQKATGLGTDDKQSSSLLDLVNVIYSIFQSVRRNSMTKEELLQKIIMNSFNFVENREVEEQIESLENLVPDWICKKSSSSGDIMYHIKKESDLDSVRSRLSNTAEVE